MISKKLEQDLIKKAKELDSMEQTDQIHEYFEFFKLNMQCQEEINKQSENKDVIVLMGQTGVGKTVIFNYISDQELIKKDNQLYTNEQLEELKNKNQSDSDTLFPTIRNFNKNDIDLIIDTPGTNDTRAQIIKLLNTINIVSCLKKTKSVKIVVVLRQDQEEGRQNVLQDVLQYLKNIVEDSQVNQLQQSLLFVNNLLDSEKYKLFKNKMDQAFQENINLRDFKKIQLSPRTQKQEQEGSEEEYYNQTNKQNFHNQIKELISIEKPLEFFEITLNDSDQQVLNKIGEITQKKIKQLLDDEIKDKKSNFNKINEIIENINQSLSFLDNYKIDEFIRQNKQVVNDYVNEKDKLIQELQNSKELEKCQEILSQIELMKDSLNKTIGEDIFGQFTFLKKIIDDKIEFFKQKDVELKDLKEEYKQIENIINNLDEYEKKKSEQQLQKIEADDKQHKENLNKNLQNITKKKYQINANENLSNEEKNHQIKLLEHQYNQLQDEDQKMKFESIKNRFKFKIMNDDYQFKVIKINKQKAIDRGERENDANPIFKYIINNEKENLMQFTQKEEDKINSKDHLGHTPLFVSRLYEQKEIETILVNKNAQLNDVDEKSKDIFEAMKNKDFEKFDLFLQQGSQDQFLFDTQIIDVNKKQNKNSNQNNNPLEDDKEEDDVSMENLKMLNPIQYAIFLQEPYYVSELLTKFPSLISYLNETEESIFVDIINFSNFEIFCQVYQFLKNEENNFKKQTIKKQRMTEQYFNDDNQDEYILKIDKDYPLLYVKDSENLNLLQLAAQQGQIDIFNLLITENIFKIDEAESKEQLPIVLALDNYDKQIVLYILDYYIKKGQKNNLENDTLLNDVFYFQNKENKQEKEIIIPYLIENQYFFYELLEEFKLLLNYINFTEEDNQKNNSIDALISQNHVELCNLVFQKINEYKDREDYLEQRKQVFKEYYQKNHQIFNNICQYFNNSYEIFVNDKNQINFKDDDDQNSLLHQYMLLNDYSSIKTILQNQYSPDINVLNNANQNILHFLLQNGEEIYEIFKLLIDKNININQEDEYKETPLMYFCQNYQEKNHVKEILDVFKSKKADFKKLNSSEQNVLHLATDNGNLEILQQLFKIINFDEKTDINKKDLFGDTPLMIAIKQEQPSEKIIKLLIEKKAKKKIDDKELSELTENQKIKDLLNN